MLWDAPLLSSWAQAFEARFGGARLRAVRPEFEARRLTLYFRETSVLIRLHPSETGLFLLEAADPPEEARPLAARLRRVHCAPDDRVLTFSFLRVRGSPAQADLFVELIPNRHNCALTEGPDRTVRTLFRTEEGRRTLRTGHPWEAPPAGDEREGRAAPVPEERWREVWESEASASHRRRALMRTFAWTSGINARALAEADPATSYASWTAVAAVARGDRAPVPVVLLDPRGAQPYPVPLPGVEHRPAPDLFAAVDAAAHTDDAPPAALFPASLLERLETHVESLRARCARIEAEAEALPEPAELRGLGDLLLARFGEVRQGVDEVELDGFDGAAVTVALDPELSPDANARRYYDRAARAERAAERLPGLAAQARAAWREASDLLERARSGEAEASEVEARIPERVTPRGAEGPALPYRRYRSSGGLEIRVGRGARSNDDLTFRHSSPGDVWLHARDVAGAHVVLRWSDDGNPPARDLAEAAILAALGSKARTSGSVPVDWTRRRYVRKPRKAAPGLVIPERVSTIFVAPDPAVEERLRVD